MRSVPREGWIVAGVVDGRPPVPSLFETVGGMPHLLRLACEMAFVGIQRIHLIWLGEDSPPDIEVLASDPRLTARATLTVSTEPVAGPADHSIMVIRSDRVFHRDIPKQAIAAWTRSAGLLGKVTGDDNDAVVVADRETAHRMVSVASEPGGMAGELARLEATGQVGLAEQPYLGFTTAPTDPQSLRSAERQLVWSLRKAADGLASKWINRHISLPISWLLARTRVHPNHVTIAAFLCAVAGGIVLSRGGYAAGIGGMLLVEFGSIIDGVDGELARLRFQFTKTGQWLDTVADDLGNIAYSVGIAANLELAGVTWAVPLAACALVSIVITQSTQYFLIARVYRSGDLAAIPWAFQSTEFLSRGTKGFFETVATTVPKLLKRDAALTIFLICAIVGRLDVVLVVFCGGALTFFAVFWFQFFRRGISSIRAQRALG